MREWSSPHAEGGPGGEVASWDLGASPVVLQKVEQMVDVRHVRLVGEQSPWVVSQEGAGQHSYGSVGHGCKKSLLLWQSMLQGVASSPYGGELLVCRLFLHQLLVPVGDLLLLGTLCFLLFSFAPFEEIAGVPSLFIVLLIVSH